MGNEIKKPGAIRDCGRGNRDHGTTCHPAEEALKSQAMCELQKITVSPPRDLRLRTRGPRSHSRHHAGNSFPQQAAGPQQHCTLIVRFEPGDAGKPAASLHFHWS